MRSTILGKAQTSQPSKTRKVWYRQWWFLLSGCLTIGVLAVVAWQVSSSPPAPTEAPEAEKILNTQAGMPFQILIPAYLPRVFDRAKMTIAVEQSGPGGEPMVELTYRSRQGAVLFIREWVPVNPDLEIMATSRPIQTKWGRGWLLNQAGNLLVMWVDIGPLRIAMLSPSLQVLPQEQLLAVAETMGPASNRQVFSFIVEPPKVRQMEPPPPVEIKINEEGIQELTLVVTPGGYSPLRFAVKKGVPVRLTFRMLGQVGCGNELNFPIGAGSMRSLSLSSPDDKQVLEFTPQETGNFEFFCGHLMYRGVMTVKE